MRACDIANNSIYYTSTDGTRQGWRQIIMTITMIITMTITMIITLSCLRRVYRSYFPLSLSVCLSLSLPLFLYFFLSLLSVPPFLPFPPPPLSLVSLPHPSTLMYVSTLCVSECVVVCFDYSRWVCKFSPLYSQW